MCQLGGRWVVNPSGGLESKGKSKAIIIVPIITYCTAVFDCLTEWQRPQHHVYMHSHLNMSPASLCIGSYMSPANPCAASYMSPTNPCAASYMSPTSL